MVMAIALAARESPGAEQVRELIKDNRFQAGFILSEPKPGKHVVYGELKALDPAGPPLWRLSQWSSRFPLDPATAVQREELMICSNAAKGITVRGTGELAMAVNSAVEYGAKARTVAEPWAHLLVEQEFEQPARLSELASARLQVEARLLRSRNLHQEDYSPDKHAAQFQIFFTVQNRNPKSAGHGDLLWFGVPLYDNRDRFPKEFKAQDFGGTAKFIFTPGGETYAKESMHDGVWVTIEKDLLPLMKEALRTAWERGFLKDSQALEDYYIGGMNMGWELPGSFDVEVQVRGLTLKAESK